MLTPLKAALSNDLIFYYSQDKLLGSTSASGSGSSLVVVVVVVEVELFICGRGVELDIFSGDILSSAFKGQSSQWDKIT